MSDDVTVAYSTLPARTLDSEHMVFRAAIVYTAAFSGTPTWAWVMAGRLCAARRSLLFVWEELFEIALGEVGPANIDLYAELMSLFPGVERAESVDSAKRIYAAVSSVARSWKSQWASTLLIWATATLDRAEQYLVPLADDDERNALPAEVRLFLRAFDSAPPVVATASDVAVAHLAALPSMRRSTMNDFFRTCILGSCEERQWRAVQALWTAAHVFPAVRPLAMVNAYYVAMRFAGVPLPPPFACQWSDGLAGATLSAGYAPSIVVEPVYAECASLKPVVLEHQSDIRTLAVFREHWAKSY